MKNPKKFRVVVSLGFFFIFASVFLDIHGTIPEFFKKGFLYTQFMPSLVNAINGTGPAAAIILVLVLLITIIYGRIYCSTVCPLGTIQDMIYRLFHYKRKNLKKLSYGKPHNIIRYSILLLTFVLFINGNIILVNIIDPYSNSGRIFSSLCKPVIIAINNNISSFLENLDIFIIPPTSYRSIHLLTVLYSIFFLILITLMTIPKGRFFCDTICPVGSILGCLSRYSLSRINIDDRICTKCGSCEKICKSCCIRSDHKKIDYNRCVTCFNCLNACPHSAIRYSHVSSINNADSDNSLKNKGRRLFILSSMAVLMNLHDKTYATGKKSEGKMVPITPPGSRGVEHFTKSCSACHLCVTTCPSNVLQPSFTAYGPSGFLQPEMDYNTGSCDFDCTICSHICPTGAILSVTTEEKKLIQIGTVEFIKEKCVVHTKKTACGACAEHCPTKAVRMVPYKDNLTIPEVNAGICIGCGACEHPCPVRPKKAIYVVSRYVHKKAEKPEIKKLEDEINEGFPF